MQPCRIGQLQEGQKRSQQGSGVGRRGKGMTVRMLPHQEGSGTIALTPLPGEDNDMTALMPHRPGGNGMTALMLPHLEGNGMTALIHLRLEAKGMIALMHPRQGEDVRTAQMPPHPGGQSRARMFPVNSNLLGSRDALQQASSAH